MELVIEVVPQEIDIQIARVRRAYCAFEAGTKYIVAVEAPIKTQLEHHICDGFAVFECCSLDEANQLL